MIQHISIRVPWHDNGWNGSVCNNPECNNACLRLKGIYENRNDAQEISICGQCMKGYEQELPCIGEGAAFMSCDELHKTVIHPYKKSSPKTHGHFFETDVTYPPYSFPAKPFAWLLKENIEQAAERYNISYNSDIEPSLSWNARWVQEADNHRAIFDYFYRDVEPDKSLCIAYAKQVPFVEDTRRVIVAIGHIKGITPAVEHNHTDDKPLRSLTWETMVSHSIRENNEDGFVIPYQKMMKYAEEHPDFDMADITVFAPDDAFDEFSYATEHVGHDAVIEVILSCIKAFQKINECLDEDYGNVLDWLNERLAEVWQDRGAFPGLGAMLCALEMPLGIVIAKEIKDNFDEDKFEFWEYVDVVIANPSKYLSSAMALKITPIMQKTWKGLSEERKTLFILLSRFALTIEQAYTIFNQNEREKADILCSDRDIIENPYILYEKTRLKPALFISVKKVDRAVFPINSIREKFPLSAPSALTSENDERRIRAVTIAVLEDEAMNGNTIYPCNLLVDKLHNLILDPKCNVTSDILKVTEKFLKEEVICREMKSGMEYYKLVRLNAFDEVIEKRIRKRLKADKLDIDADWQKIVNDYFDKGKKKKLSENEEKARAEKAAVLQELANARISVLIGNAGTGKTTVLSILCSEPHIKAGNVLLLAPTGKATVRMLDSIKETLPDDMNGITAMNVAQFLVRSKRFDWNDMRYKLSAFTYNEIPETVIIDEASMLTEEMFGSLMEVLRIAKRIIFVGDPQQLPPIGAGRPFVDLVYLLRENLENNTFPKVCDSYGELTINRRQQSETERLDVVLSRLYTATDEPPEIDVISQIEQGNNENIVFEKWETKEELEEKLLNILVRELGMSDIDDQEGFDRSLGGEIYEQYGMYFNKGCAEMADKWQILAPVRNMPQGVMNINRLIHERYRERMMGISKRYGKFKRIPKMLGPENIVYGDKVINVVNDSRDAYPKENARNYVANGEIGIACSSYSSKNPNDHLKVEFSSQKGITYSYDSHDFDEEMGTAKLELAYALTVHKSQGSQFNTVILVLAEPCHMISKELLYTALTRQLDKIIILYNNDPYHILKYTSNEYSDISKRFTDLFAEVFSDMDFRPDIVQVGNNFYEDRLIHRTIRGEMVRSKSEMTIANCLDKYKLDYLYEKPLILDGKRKVPDFTIIDADTGETWYWEHCGMMTDSKYKKNAEDKIKFYEKHGIKEGKNLIVTYDDEKGGLDSSAIDKLIRETFDL